jgi:hypothetical protein
MQATMAGGSTMAKAGRPKKAGPESKSVRIDGDILGKARIVAMRTGVPLTEYIAGLLAKPVDRDYQRTLAELASEGKGGAK